MNDCFQNNNFLTVILEQIYWYDNLTTSHILSPLAGIWIKPSRTSRMREKRADFVAGCLGGRVIAAGGLGQHIHSFPYITFTLNWWLNRAHKKGERGERREENICHSYCLPVFFSFEHVTSVYGSQFKFAPTSDVTSQEGRSGLNIKGQISVISINFSVLTCMYVWVHLLEISFQHILLQ